MPTTAEETVGTLELMDIVGCSARQIDYWVREAMIEPLWFSTQGASIPEPAYGSGMRRRFTEREVFMAKVVNCLSSFGFKGMPLKRAIRAIREHSPAARLVYVKQDGATHWGPGDIAAIVIDLDQLRLKSTTENADR